MDLDQHGGGIMAFIREYAPVKFLYAESKVIEDLYIAVNFSKKK